jgi:hypothetical protein
LHCPLHSRKDDSVLYRNAAAPWLFAAGGVVLGLVGLRAFSTMTRRTRAGVADASGDSETRDPAPTRAPDSAPAPSSEHAAAQHSGENVSPTEDGQSPQMQPRAFSREAYDEELEVALNGSAPIIGDAYDAVAPDELATEWLSRATQGAMLASPGEPLDPEVAELLRDAGLSLVSEGSLNFASPDELEAAVGIDLEGTEDQFELEFDYSGVMSRQ